MWEGTGEYGHADSDMETGQCKVCTSLSERT
jgi:hypothetical protein